MDVEKKIWVYDLEQLRNFHSGTFMDRDDPTNVRVFVIHKSRNDMFEYYKFLKEEVAGLIGFNCINYDYPLLHFFMAIMTIANEKTTADGFNELLSEESQRIINTEYSAIPERDTRIPQLDLYRIHHFDNKAKMTSLKYLQINIKYHNVQDIPFDEDHYITEEEIPEILAYNFNDVDSTREFYFLSVDMIELRKKLSTKYRINLRNANDPKIGQEIFGREIARKLNINYKVLRDMRTYRRSINLKDCVLPQIKFKSKEFNRILEFFKQTTIVTTYKAFEESVIYKGFKYDYGTGGLHGCIDSGVYESDEYYEIIDIDVSSYYPNIAIQNNFYPQHLGESFVEVYREIIELKNEAGRIGDKTTKSGMKLSANGVYGKSNDQYSLFYDPKYTMRVTINGQLMLSMLAESLALTLGELVILQVNTDGITIKIPRNYRGVVDRICKEWEEETGLTLEYAQYKKMVIRDVNNYLAITTDDKAKPKGCFEIIPMQNGAIAYNKNWSMRVVPKALHAYYIDGIKPEDFVVTHDDIYDFTIGFRAKGSWDVWATFIENCNKVKVKQQKTLRYFMSKTGAVLTKENRDDGRIISLEASRTTTIFNKYVDLSMEEYNIDYGYYLREINKIINAVDDGQLKLF
jgi:DNA polymerase elongation subunit (family B)